MCAFLSPCPTFFFYNKHLNAFAQSLLHVSLAKNKSVPNVGTLHSSSDLAAPSDGNVTYPQLTRKQPCGEYVENMWRICGHAQPSRQVGLPHITSAAVNPADLSGVVKGPAPGGYSHNH
jgi:hypothetical protein